ncbi:MAG TPA: hypothetical protein VH394_17010 [Thermoanaerobaculia bacterium]|nr:hypothetical protein [Thermoanaerobaculia bacterium]
MTAPTRSSRVGGAIAFGLLYGAVQAVLPPMGELAFSLALHLTLLALFATFVFRGYRLFAASIAVVFYLAVLSLAIALPFKYLDTRVSLPNPRITVKELPEILREAGYKVSVREQLPQRIVPLSTDRPTLRQLDTALHRSGYFLRPLSGCANAVSLSFLWGPRVSGRTLLLRRL